MLQIGAFLYYALSLSLPLSSRVCLYVNGKIYKYINNLGRLGAKFQKQFQPAP